MKYLSRLDGPEYAKHVDTHIYALRELGLPIDKIIASLECGNMPKCIKEAIKYGIANGLEFHPDDSPFKDDVWDSLSEGLNVGYENILEPTCVLAESSIALPDEQTDAIGRDVNRHLKLDKSFNEIKKSIPYIDGHAGVSLNDEPVLAITNLLIYAANVQHQSGIKFCK